MATRTDPDLGAREHTNFIEAMRILGSTSEGFLNERDRGIATLATGLPFRLFNQILVEDPDADPGAIQPAVDRLRDRGDRFALNLRKREDEQFIGAALAAGLQLMSEDPWMPGMAWSPLPSDPLAGPALPAGAEIRRVDDAQGIEDHITAVAVGFEFPESIARAVISDRLLERPEVAVYVGYLDGVPVASGLGLRTGQTIGVYNIATIESARGRGFGAAMTARVVADGVADGCDVAVLQASEMGYPIYERLGFHTVVEYVGYIDPEPAADPTPAG